MEWNNSVIEEQWTGRRVEGIGHDLGTVSAFAWRDGNDTKHSETAGVNKRCHWIKRVVIPDTADIGKTYWEPKLQPWIFPNRSLKQYHYAICLYKKDIKICMIA
jgi:hypothetical protein